MQANFTMTDGRIGHLRGAGGEAAQYLSQAADACRKALQVRTEDNFPIQWIRTMVNLARAYELKRERTSALETYRRLLRHYPDDKSLKQKADELAKSP
jgi:hypothetical protein